MTNQRIAVVPGSFDPITNGHIDVIRRATELYDKVFVAVMINDQKKYRFTLEEREAIARAALEGLERVEVISSRGWLWELAKDIGACAIVKGYRNETDLEYEQKMAEFNKEHNPDAETVLLKASDGLETLSSTVVRERMLNDEQIDGLLPEKAIELIKKLTPRD
ncbi:MAG: pantetheine-phosphate adenylyltransferase [Clostridia bacterium]|nr:pantetheine-phosphate adenylyltransferase [Clostridia bacterium]